ncbi:MAG: VanW family protein [Lachnospiraceae bacterium]|nr:VanW family protein [Lachnospiraceae bacterium]
MSELERGRRTAGQSRAKGSAKNSRKSSSSSRSSSSTSAGRSSSRSSTGRSSSSRSSRSTSSGYRSSGYGRSSYTSARRSRNRRGSGSNLWLFIVVLVLFVAAVSIIFAVRGKKDAGDGSEAAESTANATSGPEIELEKEVLVDGISITGMSRDAAKGVILKEFPWSMQVKYGEEVYEVANLMETKVDQLLDEIYSGKAKESYTLDTSGLEDAVAAQAAAAAQKWDKKAKNGAISSFDKSSNKFVFSGSENGLAVDQEKLIADMNAAISQKQFDAVIEAAVSQVSPEFGEAAAKEKYKTISTVSTNTTANSKRNTNVRLACEAINGTILQPGQEFSFNDVVGQRTEAKGYQAAAAYNNGEVVQEIGGGVCQVSTTLYNAVLKAGLKTTVRRSHTYEPSYITPGQDATISFGGPDYKFMNNSDMPIGIRASYGDQVCTVSIYGVPILEEGVTYSLKSTKLKDIDSPAPTYEEDPTLQPGEEKVKSNGSLGSYWETRLVIKKDGEIISQEVDHNTTYRGHAPVILRNTSGTVVSPAETTEAETVIHSDGAADGFGTGSGAVEESSEEETKAVETKPAESATAAAPSTTAAPDAVAPNENGPGFSGPGSSETVSGQGPGNTGNAGGPEVIAPNPLTGVGAP